MKIMTNHSAVKESSNAIWYYLLLETLPLVEKERAYHFRKTEDWKHHSGRLEASFIQFQWTIRFSA